MSRSIFRGGGQSAKDGVIHRLPGPGLDERFPGNIYLVHYPQTVPLNLAAAIFFLPSRPSSAELALVLYQANRPKNNNAGLVGPACCWITFGARLGFEDPARSLRFPPAVTATPEGERRSHYQRQLLQFLL
jgi:hypothetical protein